MTVASIGSEPKQVDEALEAYADGRLWQRARDLHVIMVGLVVAQLVMWAFFPSEFSRLKLSILGMTVAVYSFGIWWHLRTVQRVRKGPVVRIDSDALSVFCPESRHLRVIPWAEVDRIAWRGLDEIGVRLQAPGDEIAEVVSIPTTQLSAEAPDQICAAIEARLGD